MGDFEAASILIKGIQKSLPICLLFTPLQLCINSKQLAEDENMQSQLGAD